MRCGCHPIGVAEHYEHHRRPIDVVVEDARILEQGESDQTPAFAIITVGLFLLPFVLVLMGIALGVYYGIS